MSKTFSQLRESQFLTSVYEQFETLSEETIFSLLEDVENDAEFRDVLFYYAVSKNIITEDMLNQEIYFSEMESDILFDLIEGQNVDDEIVANAILTLYEREEIDLYEDQLEYVLEATKALPAPKSTALTKPASSSVGTANKPMKNMGWAKSMGSPKISGPTAPVGSAAKTTLGSVAKSALGAAGRLASKYAPHAAALTGGYQAGKALNKASSTVSGVTDKIGSSIAKGLQSVGIGKAPEVIKAKSPQASYKPSGAAPQTTVPAKSGGGTVTFPKAAPMGSGTAPKISSAPKSSPMGSSAAPTQRKALPTAKSVTKTVTPTPSMDMDDLRASAAKMRAATQDLTKKTGSMVGSLQKIAPSGRMERPVSPSGMSSSNIHKSIASLGGEPTKPVSKPTQPVAPAKPPQLSSTQIKKNPTSGGGKWM